MVFPFFLPRRLQFLAQQNWFCNFNWVVVVFFLFFFGVQQTKFSWKSFCFLPFCRRILHFLLDKLMSIHNKSICHFEVAMLLVTITGGTAQAQRQIQNVTLTFTFARFCATTFILCVIVGSNKMVLRKIRYVCLSLRL